MLEDINKKVNQILEIKDSRYDMNIDTIQRWKKVVSSEHKDSTIVKTKSGFKAVSKNDLLLGEWDNKEKFGRLVSSFRRKKLKMDEEFFSKNRSSWKRKVTSLYPKARIVKLVGGLETAQLGKDIVGTWDSVTNTGRISNG